MSRHGPPGRPARAVLALIALGCLVAWAPGGDTARDGTATGGASNPLGGASLAVVPPFSAATRNADASAAGASGAGGSGAGGAHGTPHLAASPGASTAPGNGGTLPAPLVARRIRIDRLGIDLPIVEGDGIDAPLNKAAHYPGTGWPGGGTNIYLYAHARPGMFVELAHAQRDDEVDLALADGSIRAYRVTQVLPRVPWNALEYTRASSTERLTLQTCTGDTAQAPRLIVIAVPKGQA
jgi:LPXTG-site transpeptidase (sortase) family protein